MEMVNSTTGILNQNIIYIKEKIKYRMKFPLRLPTLFARFRVQVYDFSIIGSARLCGETTISLKKLKNNSTYIVLVIFGYILWNFF